MKKMWLGLVVLVMISCEKGIPNNYNISGILYVVNKRENSVTKFDLEKRQKTGQIRTGNEPHEIDISPDEKLLAITNYKDSLITIYNIQKRETSNIVLTRGSMPHGLKFLNDSVFLCTSEGTNELLMLDARAGKVIRRLNTVDKPVHMMALNPRNNLLYLSNKFPGTILEVNLNQWRVVRQIPIEENIEGIGVSPSGRELWVTHNKLNKVNIFDTEAMEITHELSTDDDPVRIIFDNRNSLAFVVNAHGNSIQVVDIESKEFIRRISFKSGIEWLYDLFHKTPVPVGIIMHKDHQHLFISAGNADKVYLLDLNQWKFTGELSTGDLPDGLVLQY